MADSRVQERVKEAIDGQLTCAADGCQKMLYSDKETYCPEHADQGDG